MAGVFLAAAVALAAVGCGKRNEQPGSSVQAGSASSAVSSSQAADPAGSGAQSGASDSAKEYASLAEWYTSKKIDFSELNQLLTDAVDGYTADVQVEGDTLTFRYIRSNPIQEDDKEALEAESKAMEAAYAKGESALKEYCAQIAEESGISSLKARIEVMNEDTTNASTWKELN